jgi:hypothetical protein
MHACTHVYIYKCIHICMYVCMYVCSLCILLCMCVCSFETIKPYTLDPYHGHNFGFSSFIMMMFLVPICVLKCSTIIFPLVSQIGSTNFFKPTLM